MKRLIVCVVIGVQGALLGMQQEPAKPVAANGDWKKSYEQWCCSGTGLCVSNGMYVYTVGRMIARDFDMQKNGFFGDREPRPSYELISEVLCACLAVTQALDNPDHSCIVGKCTNVARRIMPLKWAVAPRPQEMKQD